MARVTGVVAVLIRDISLKLVDFEPGTGQIPLYQAVPTVSMPTVRALLFDAIDQTVSVYVKMPSNWDTAVDVQVLLDVALVTSESNNDTINSEIDYTVTTSGDATDGLLTKSSTNIAVNTTVTTAGGLAPHNVHTINFTLPATGGSNPFPTLPISSTETGAITFEFHLTNLSQVTAIRLLGGMVQFGARF